jgi:hypothetical protein
MARLAAEECRATTGTALAAGSEGEVFARPPAAPGTHIAEPPSLVVESAVTRRRSGSHSPEDLMPPSD